MLQPGFPTLRKSLIMAIAMALAGLGPQLIHGDDKIRIGYGSLSTSYASIWVAGEARLFQKNGIDAEVLYLESALVRTALLTGDIAMGGMSGTTMAAPRLQGADPILLASFSNSLQYRLMVRPEIRTASILIGAQRRASVLLHIADWNGVTKNNIGPWPASTIRLASASARQPINQGGRPSGLSKRLIEFPKSKISRGDRIEPILPWQSNARISGP